MEYKCKCGSTDLFTEQKGNNLGLYCSKCGKWIKWLNKDEARLFEHKQKVMIMGCGDKNNLPKNKNVEWYKNQLSSLIEFLDKTIDNEMDKIPLSQEDAIRKSSYCLALERDKNALCNILNGKDWSKND